MDDDWRLRVQLADPGAAVDLADALERGELEHELVDAAGDRVIVSIDDAMVFLYTAGRAQAERAEAAVRALATKREWSGVEVELRHWHPEAEDWEDPDAPLPDGDAARAAEHASLIERERVEAAALGFSPYEVRITCASHAETVALAEQLRADGVPTTRRWRYLLVGAADEDAARALADRITGLVPAGTTVTVEGSLAAIAAETPANPFAVFGGLGG